jgi:hypothetical protein
MLVAMTSTPICVHIDALKSITILPRLNGIMGAGGGKVT